MMAKDKIKTSKAIELEAINETHNQNVVDNGFLDMPDLQNEDFIYVY